jgi:hypothetical protein
MKSLLTHPLKAGAIAMATVMIVGLIVTTGRGAFSIIKFFVLFIGSRAPLLLHYGHQSADTFAADELGQSYESLTNWQLPKRSEIVSAQS